MNTPGLEQARHELAAEILRSRGRFRLRVTGTSMLPTLWPGDILTVQAQDCERAQYGELVLFHREGRFFVHRVVRKLPLVQETLLVTRGDCMPQEDPPVSPAGLLGRVTEIDREGWVFAPNPRPSTRARILAGILRRSDLARAALMWLRELSRRVLSRESFGVIEPVR